MKKGIHRGLGLLLAIVVVAMLAACSTKDSVSEVPDKDDSDAIVPPASVLPFADVVDLSEYFVDEPVEFSESTPKGELVCVNIDESQYSKADDTILLPNEKTKAMAVHCTWASASRTIYIGFIDEVSEEVYTLSAVGGALTGTLDLSSLPEGEYRPIMYSSDNQNINAVMLYQFHLSFVDNLRNKGWVRRVPAAAVIPAAQVVVDFIESKTFVAGLVNPWVNREA